MRVSSSVLVCSIRDETSIHCKYPRVTGQNGSHRAAAYFQLMPLTLPTNACKFSGVPNVADDH